MTQRNPIAPGQGARDRVAELHRLCNEDYVKARQPNAPSLALSYAAMSAAAAVPAIEPTDLDVAIRVAQRMLGTYGTIDGSSVYAYTVAHGGLVESLRLLLRALDVKPGDTR